MLDYGCGDGTFLAMAANRISRGVGVDIAAEQIADCRSRLAPLVNLEFATVDDFKTSESSKFRKVFCMETLEHCTSAGVETVLADLERSVHPGGQVIISVPIETGLPFFLKAAVRRLAAARGLSEYKYYERYGLRLATRMIFAGSKTDFARPLYGDPSAPYHSHFGFNWRMLRERIRQRLVVEQTRFSPLGFLHGAVSSQAWFICRPPQAARP